MRELQLLCLKAAFCIRIHVLSQTVRLDHTRQCEYSLGILTDGRSLFEAAAAANDEREGERDDGRGPAFLSPLGPVTVTLELSFKTALIMTTEYVPNYAPGAHRDHSA